MYDIHIYIYKYIYIYAKKEDSAEVTGLLDDEITTTCKSCPMDSFPVAFPISHCNTCINGDTYIC